MKRITYTVKANGEIISSKSTWNSSRKKIVSYIKEYIKTNNIPVEYIEVDLTYTKDGFEFSRGSSLWKPKTSGGYPEFSFTLEINKEIK